MDKASVFGDTVNYLKHLQDRLKTLEEQAANEAMVVNKSQIMGDGDDDEGSSSSISYEQPLPEIEARVSDKSVLLKIHCKKRNGVLVKILSEIEKLNLGVVNINVTPFGNLTLDITIIAETDKDKEICVAAKDIRKALRSALLQAAEDD